MPCCSGCQTDRKTYLIERFAEENYEEVVEINFKEMPSADALYKKGYSLYFYKNETTKKELDIIIQKDGQVIPIEVKGGNNRANSLNSALKKYDNITCGYKFIDGNIGVDDNGVITMPLYMAAFF